MSICRRVDLCNAVKQIICVDRQNQYGSPEDSHELIAKFWSAYLGKEIFPEDVANMMELMKIARRKGQKFNPDNYIDGAGYAILGCILAETAIKENGHAEDSEYFTST